MDDELKALLVRELARYVAELEASFAPIDARRAAHALRGSLAMAGEREVADAFGRLERRLVAGDPRAPGDLVDLVRGLLERLEEGRALPTSAWPEPPDDLTPTPVSSGVAAEYLAQVHDRLGRLDATAALPDEAALVEVYREIHTLKGAALAVGDELMAWFCHGLEERLRAARTPEATKRVLEDVRSYRGVLAEIVDAPDHAIATLRLLAGAPARSSRPPLPTPLPLPPRRPSPEARTESDVRSLSEDGTVRVSSATLDAILERTGQLGQFRAPLSASSSLLSRAARSTYDLSREVKDALRLIGPPKPWGAPAAAIHKLERCARELAPLARLLDDAAERATSLGGRIRRQTDQLSGAVQSLRTTHASLLFERVAQGARTEAKRAGKEVEVVVQGGDTPIDRRLVDALVEPLRQLARNAIVHGLEAPDERAAAGKPSAGVIRLGASRRGGSIVFAVGDDGAGVDTASVRKRAVESGVVPESTAAALGDAALLTLLFYPGFSLRREADLLAGRGVGLDLTLAAVHRLGGTIHLESKRGVGLTATVVVPAEGSLVRVVWLTTAGTVYALPVQHVGQVSLAGPGVAVVPLARLVRAAPTSKRPVRFGVEVTPPIDVARPLIVGVDEVGPVDEVALRPLPAFVRATGPWSAGISWADDVRLSLDPLRLHHLATSSTAAA